jgi:hypothetical protein
MEEVGSDFRPEFELLLAIVIGMKEKDAASDSRFFFAGNRFRVVVIENVLQQAPG